ncbi:Fic/DOC family protein [Amycolatopsis sp. NPDC004378]
MTDPYLIPGTDCLANKLDLEDPAELRAAEGEIVAYRDIVLSRETLPGEYNLTHMQAFHRALFGDVYAWAGQIRTVNIHKGRTTFALTPFIEDETSSVLAGLEDDGWMIGLSLERFVERLAYYYGELNACHPFREGNGRTLRAFLRQLSAAAGFRLDWSALDKVSNIAASEHAWRTKDYSQLRQVLAPVVVRM